MEKKPEKSRETYLSIFTHICAKMAVSQMKHFVNRKCQLAVKEFNCRFFGYEEQTASIMKLKIPYRISLF